MKSIVSKAILGITLLSISSPAMAREGRGQHGGHGEGQNQGQKRRGMQGAQARIERQKAHIQHALDKGKITEDQAAALQGKVDAIQEKKKAALSDGKVTKEERTEIKGDLKASKEEIRNAIKPSGSSQESSSAGESAN